MKNINSFVIFDISIICFLILSIISVLSVILLVYLNFSKQDFNANSIRKLQCYLYIEEYILSFVFAIWVFSLFVLKIALLLWIGIYIINNFIFIPNKIIKSICETNKQIIIKQFKNNKNTYLNLFKIKCTLKKTIYGGTFWRFKCFFKYRTTFGVGLIIASIVVLFFDSGEPQTAFELLLNYFTLLTTVLYYIYPIAHWGCVKNEGSHWYGHNVFFSIQYILYSLLFYIILGSITLS